MSGEKDLKTLLVTMDPELQKGEFVFVSVQHIDQIPRGKTILEFQEKEGITLVVTKQIAEEFSLHYEYVSAWITLKVHSALDAVGLTAAFSNQLASHNISCNVVSGFYHDHIFVAVEKGRMAVQILQEFSESMKS
ncbi:MAG: ACT domain-containing protein [Bacteroidota bacterium]